MFQDCIKNALIVLVLSLFCSSAFSKDYQEGRHYELIEPLPTRNPKKIEVIEFFWFGCGHCFTLEGSLTDWKKELPTSVDFYRYPVIWNKMVETHAKLFFIAEALSLIHISEPTRPY